LVQFSTSYELAAKQIKHATGLIINDETIRSVANTLGKIAFDNDVKTAIETVFFNSEQLPIQKQEKKKMYFIY
jgi:hypothetical protein